MSNEQKAITGYRKLTDQEVDLMNEGKDLAEKCRKYVEKLHQYEHVDHRWLTMGEADLQVGFMQAFRSIARPETF